MSKFACTTSLGFKPRSLYGPVSKHCCNYTPVASITTTAFYTNPHPPEGMRNKYLTYENIAQLNLLV